MNLIASVCRPKAAQREHGLNRKQVVGFEVRQPRARSVWFFGITGDWHPSFISLGNKGNGLWTKRIELVPGDFSYRLNVDGSWTDTAATVKTDHAPRGTITRFFTIPRIAVAKQERRQDAAPESPPSNDFLASDNPHQRGFIHSANCRN